MLASTHLEPDWAFLPDCDICGNALTCTRCDPYTGGDWPIEAWEAYLAECGEL